MNPWRNGPQHKLPPHPERADRWRHDVTYAAADFEPQSGTLGITTYRIAVPAGKPSGFKFAFVSDLHWQPTASAQKRLGLLAELLKERRPEFLLLGGDAVSDATEMPGLPRALSMLSAAVPAAVAVPGNWERGKRWIGDEEWRKIFSDGGFKLLINESCRLGDCTVCGVDDSNAFPRPPAPPPQETCNLLLVHRPDVAVELDDGDALSPFDLITCGHTHCGQVRLPLLGGVFRSGMYRHHFDYGEYRRAPSGPRMIVSSGVGEITTRPRIGVRRELVLVEIVSAAGKILL